ncbi:MAG: putative rane-anchored protein [Candidatus Saccharibacteria bacterium]|nr:putative rane-anchored protein [Candidatus Saccharibacteria bacterium]
MGETTSDFLANAMSPYLAVAIGFIAFAIALTLQFRAKRYIPWVYWLAVAMVAVFGTMAADVLHKQLNVPYVASTAFFAVCLTAIFITWQKVEHSLSIHSITSTRREVFYWLTVMATFALGTATGDWTANSLGLGYLSSGILFAVVILIPLIGRRFKLNEIFTFWFAYVITRPLGASFADWFGKPVPNGLGHGDGTVSVALSVLIICCVLYMSLDRHERLLERD